MVTIHPFPGTSSPQESSSDRPHVRTELTSRGRFVVTALAFLAGVLVAVVVLFALGVPSALAEDTDTAPTVTVQAGDTLWAYAEQCAPEGTDTTTFIERTRSLNGLASGRLTEGQRLELPNDCESLAAAR
jgi:hypothetical protein